MKQQLHFFRSQFLHGLTSPICYWHIHSFLSSDIIHLLNSYSGISALSPMLLWRGGAKHKQIISSSCSSNCCSVCSFPLIHHAVISSEISATSTNLCVRAISECQVPEWVSNSTKSSKHIWVSSMMKARGTARNKLSALHCCSAGVTWITTHTALLSDSTFLKQTLSPPSYQQIECKSCCHKWIIY